MLISNILGNSHNFDEFNLFEYLLSKGLSLLENRSWKWRLYDLYILYRSFISNKNIYNNILYCCKSREIAICFLLCMHNSLLEYLLGNKPIAHEYLIKANYYQELLGMSMNKIKNLVDPGNGFSQSWLMMRRIFIKQYSILVKSNYNVTKKYYSTIDWAYE